MKSTRTIMGVCSLLFLVACASKPDRFYTLSILPAGERGALSTPATHVLLSVSVPTLVDRAEMVMNTPKNGVLILDHERWAVSFSDQVAQTLARDIERRRSDVLIGDRGFDQAATPSVAMKVDIIRMSASVGGRVSVEAHWRIVDASSNVDEIGSDLFEAPIESADYASVAQAYSQALGALAERLTQTLRRR